MSNASAVSTRVVLCNSESVYADRHQELVRALRRRGSVLPCDSATGTAEVHASTHIDMSVPELETRHAAEVMDPVYRSVPSLAGVDWLIRLEHAWPWLATQALHRATAALPAAPDSRRASLYASLQTPRFCCAGPGGTSTAGSLLCATSLRPVLSTEVSRSRCRCQSVCPIKLLLVSRAWSQRGR